MLWHRVEADFAVPWLVHINMDGGSCRWTGHLYLGVCPRSACVVRDPVCMETTRRHLTQSRSTIWPPSVTAQRLVSTVRPLWRPVSTALRYSPARGSPKLPQRLLDY